jgi:hypothetical protein
MTAPRVRLRPLKVTAQGTGPVPNLVLPAQVCWAANLTPGEVVEVHNETTGAIFRLRVGVGAWREVQVNGCADIGVGHSLTLTAAHGAKPGSGCTVCLCERNQVIEIRDASAPPLPGQEARENSLAECEATVSGPHLSLVNLNPGPPRETYSDPGGGHQTAE